MEDALNPDIDIALAVEDFAWRISRNGEEGVSESHVSGPKDRRYDPIAAFPHALRASDLHVAAAMPGVGVRSFLLNLLTSCLDEGLSCAVMLTSSDVDAFIEDMLSFYAAVDMRTRRAMPPDGDGAASIKRGLDSLARLPLTLIDTRDLDLVEDALDREPRQVLFVEDAHLITFGDSVASSACALKWMAKRRGTPVVTSTVLEPHYAAERASAPSLLDFRRSHGLASVADSVTLIDRSLGMEEAEEADRPDLGEALVTYIDMACGRTICRTYDVIPAFHRYIPKDGGF